jgi:ADP-heptose:LPS heptosyltransferase
MFEGARHSLGVRLATWRFRKSRDEIISFTSAVSSARQALVIMPLTVHEVLSTVRVVEMLKTQFKEEHITVVTGNHGPEVIRMLPRGRFIHLLKPQVSYLFQPRADFLNSIKEKRYDLAIDLNLDFVLPSGYICKASGAKIRVGFNHHHADAFYNFQIKPDPTLGRKLIYDRLVQCLQKF